MPQKWRKTNDTNHLERRGASYRLRIGTTGPLEAGRVPGRRLNGDETAHGRTVRLGDTLAAGRVRLNGAVTPVHHQERW